METKKNNEQTEVSTNFQNLSKEFPGYTPNPKSETTNDAFTDVEPKDEDSAARLAAKGSVRNSNYHELNDKSRRGNYINKSAKANHKTLEDYNKTDPKRDINTATVVDKSRPSGIAE